MSTFRDTHTPGARLIRGANTTPEPSTLALISTHPHHDDTADTLNNIGATHQRQRYLFEDESVVPVGNRTAVNLGYTPLIDTTRMRRPGQFFDPDWVVATTQAFERTWDTLAAPLPQVHYEPAEHYVPADWVPFLPYPTINPAQAEAIPAIMDDGHVFVVAPTGAGKTVIGMTAALRAIKEKGRKAAWLVPQRSLTAELDRELESWRKQGLRVQRLSGEAAVDVQRVREADIWVATTEKFESLCRSSAMHDAVDEVGTLIVDEIHLLGDPSRGPLLETILARLRAADTDMRLVGLSATAANAAQVAEWLNARLVTISWRPTRLTQQVLAVPSGMDRAAENRYRSQASAALTQRISDDGGSVIVFCGTKHSVRSTALAIAASRGAESGIDPDDVDDVARVCATAGVGLHYSDWPHRLESEELFRNRDINVLVATSTLAAGVNLPARAVVVRDTRIGTQHMDISTVQQMFGRAGRAGQEQEGWAFLLTTPDETGPWRRRIAAGYTINSGLADRPHDYLLSEIVQGRVRNTDEGERWWMSTFACHQGSHGAEPAREAMGDLEKWGHITVADTEEAALTATGLGRLTCRMMVNVHDAAGIHARLRASGTPRNTIAAEDAIIEALVKGVTQIGETPAPPPSQRRACAKLLVARGDIRQVAGLSGQGEAKRGDVARAALLLAARSPHALSRPDQTHVAGVSRRVLVTALDTSTRYLAWLAAQGSMGTAPGWAAVAGFDLSKRVTWHQLAPPRGAGRLLWLAERVGGADGVETLWDTWRTQGATCPDDVVLKSLVAPSVLQGRARLTVKASRSGSVAQAEVAASPDTSVFAAVFTEEKKQVWRRVPLRAGRGTMRVSTPVLMAAFGADGDCRGSGWLSGFAAVKTS